MHEVDQAVNSLFHNDKWRRACNAQHDCVEVQATPRSVGVRDSKSAGGAPLAFGWRSWTGFLSRVSV